MNTVDFTTTILGYRIVEQLYTSSRTLLYRAIREEDQQPVVIKLLRQDYPTAGELLQFRNQYTIAKHLNLPSIVQPYSLENYRNGYALVMEDFGGISLKEYAKGRPLHLPEFLSIALQLSTILNSLYAHYVIHKDIKPANLLINPTSGQIKLIDFSIASLLPREQQILIHPNVLEGTLAYLSPEQTGRMNRGIDYRTDFYSLGVTFYELLTGQLPFQSDDPMELIHSHLAKQPPAVHTLNLEIPTLLSQVVAKLMAKNAEDRYQSALGLKHDLETCLHHWQQVGTIPLFPLGQRDISDRLVISEKLYGRDQEVATLLAAFERVAGRKEESGTIEKTNDSAPSSPVSTSPQSELILVAGFSGIGKTAIVNEVHKPISRQRGYFMRGKFDQFQRNIPFSAFVQAFRDLMAQLLTESDAQIERWKLKILKALGENAQVIIDVIPELESIIGPQPPAIALSGVAAQNRFNLLFQNFIRIFTTQDHPLVIFLDDLQWSDAASLKLMQLLLSDAENGYLLLIGAYRDNEVFATHPLMLTVNELRQAGAVVSAIGLAPLQTEDLNQLIADSLHCASAQVSALTQLVYQKTKGNPFFSSQFLKSLHEEELISFNYQAGHWQWDLAQIKTLSLSDDVLEFMGLQFQKLPQPTQAVLQLAACIGNQFDLASLSVVSQKSPAETAADLWEALQEGLILPHGETYKFFYSQQSSAATLEPEAFRDRSIESISPIPFPSVSLPESMTRTADACSYKFFHDRVQQAAYDLIPAADRPAIHLKIGQLLWRSTAGAEREEKIFEIINHLNLGRQLITETTQRAELAQLNLQAGQKAKASTAYADAIRYFHVGITQLSANAWQDQYALTLALHEEATEAACLNGDFEQMQRSIEIVLQHARTLLDQVKVYQVKIDAHKARNQRVEAVKTGLSVLKLLGVEFPESPAIVDIQQGMAEIQTQLTGKRIQDLLHLPEMSDPHILSAMRILSSMNSAAYFATPALFPLIVFKQVSLSLQYGNAAESAFAYACYGISLCGVVGDIIAGYQFGQLALNVLDRLNAEALKSVTTYVVNVMIRHWQEPVRETLPSLLAAYQIGLQTGDLEHAAFSAEMYCYNSFYVGQELTKLEREMATYSDVIRQLRQETPLYQNELYRQTVLNLIGTTDDPCILNGKVYDEQIMRPLHEQANDRSTLCIFYLHKMSLCYLFQNYPQALENAILAEQHLDAVTSKTDVPSFYVYDSLIRLAQYFDVPTSEQQAILARVSANQEKVQTWATYSPANHLHRFYLIAAEQCRFLGQNTEAMEYYDRAIAEAEKNRYENDKALIYERAAQFYLAWGRDKVAQVYLADAYYSYIRWGAFAKVKDLEQRYPQLLASILSLEKTDFQASVTTSTGPGALQSTSSSLAKVLDLAAVVKASQALSGEIQLEKLLSALMQILIENSGAEKGVLILPQDEGWIIAAQVEADLGHLPGQTTADSSPKAVSTALLSVPLQASQSVPRSIIHYVSRTSETLVLDDASTETAFATDVYVIHHKPKSVLCTPICHQGQWVGILYLENNLTAAAFTRDRLAVLNLLTAQAAISLQNAMLYNTLEQKVQLRTQELHENNQSLTEALSELQRTQTQLIQTEKMSSLGQMVAGVAHEINNPINFIYGNLMHANEYCHNLLDLIEKYQHYYPQPIGEIEDDLEAMDFDFLKEDLQKLMRSMQVGADRIRQIVLSLRNFSRLDEAEMKPVDIHEGIDSTLLILQHRLKERNNRPAITVLKEYGPLPQVACYASQLNQVFMNILNNAIDALEMEGGQPESGSKKTQPSAAQIQIRTQLIDAQTVMIQIADNGPGMSEPVKQRLFDPFFTTKPVGKGTGLGLSISYSIVEKHGGQIQVHSQPGQGTAFTIVIPLNQSVSQPQLAHSLE